MNPSRYLVFGFHSSGKTTFAAALWHLIDSREVQTALAKGRHVGEFRYLEEIAQAWCEGWQVERTRTEQVEAIKINLSHPESGTELILEFADLSGETFEKAFTTRLCTPTLVNLVKEASGLLLFVTADRVIDDVTILDAFAGEEAEQAPAEDEHGEATSWDSAKTPLQVQIVDLLQALLLPPFAKGPGQSSCHRIGLGPHRRDFGAGLVSQENAPARPIPEKRKWRRRGSRIRHFRAGCATVEEG